MFSHLGPEPLEYDTLGLPLDWGRNKKRSAKVHLMDASTVVGVGNIMPVNHYLSGIRPTKQCSKISKKNYDIIASNIVQVLESSIQPGWNNF